MNLGVVLSTNLEEMPQYVFSDGEQKITFEELNKYSDSLSAYISNVIDEDDLIIISANNSVNFVISYLSSLKSERIILLIPSLKLLGVYIDYLKTFKRTLVITDEIEKINLLGEISLTSRVLNINSVEFKSNLYRNKNIKSFKKVADDTILLLITGGTTGIPKLVELTNSNLLSNLYQIKEVVQSNPLGESLITVMPFFHAFGLLVGIHFPIFFGMNAYIKKEFLAKDFLSTIISNQIEICFVVPHIIRIFNKILEQEKIRLPLKLCVSGADKLERAEYENFKDITDINIIEGYGLTETSPVTHLNPLDCPKPESIGKPLPQTTCKILNDQLLVKGPQVMKAYFNNIQETENVFLDGFLKTGDVAEVDEDGFYFIKGRIKDVIKYDGESIFPYEIEKVISKMEGVAESAVIGKNDTRHGQVAVAFVVKKENVELEEKDILNYLYDKLPKKYIPKQIIFLDSLPKTVLGKVKKFVLQQYLQ